MKKQPAKTPQPSVSPPTLPVSDLHFDPRNPRLVEYGDLSKAKEPEQIRLLVKSMAVDEVYMSIATSGFWDYEPLFVVREGGKWIVIEGNRRLAAVKLLLDPKMAEELGLGDMTKPSKSVLESLRELPVRIVGTRNEVWRHLGFKHVNGPSKWRSFAKAEYIARVHEEDDKVSLPKIAEQIGDRNRTVQRLFRALMVLRQAERTGVYRREWCYKPRLPFSHLMTALDYDGYAKFIGLASEEEERSEPVSKKRLKELGELCVWLWGDKRGDGIKPIIGSQNPDLRNLEQVLRSEASLSALRRGEPLAVAFETSKGDEIVFRDALQEAKALLIKAQGRVTTGFDGDSMLLNLADGIADMAHDLVDAMRRRAEDLRGGRRKRERVED